MRQITSHKINGLNDSLEITARDEPGSGGANHLYHIAFPTGKKKAAATIIGFQNGPVSEAGVNGISNESLLAILIDRLECFQAGPNPCNENMHALVKLAEAMDWLKKRTHDRLARNVEGTSQQ